jgi:hypothetical protein
MPLHFAVDTGTGQRTEVEVHVHSAYNFGYAARDTAGIEQHISELQALGLPAPSRLPAIYPIPADRIRNAKHVTVSGDDTYGEVEFALINTADGWLVTIASDHTDLEVEKVNMAKAKATCPDIVGETAWRLDDVVEGWDDLVLRLWGRTPDGIEQLVQSGSVNHLLAPADLQRILIERGQVALTPGTVVLSGTIDGAPTPGMRSWRATLEDPRSGRLLELEYSLTTLDAEL